MYVICPSPSSPTRPAWFFFVLRFDFYQPDSHTPPLEAARIVYLLLSCFDVLLRSHVLDDSAVQDVWQEKQSFFISNKPGFHPVVRTEPLLLQTSSDPV